MIHELKQEHRHFEDVLKGLKTFEVRKNNRDYRVGDLLALNEYDPYSGYSGRCCLVYIDYILNDEEYCKDGYVIMAIKPCVVHLYRTPFRPEKGTVSYEVPQIEYEEGA